MRELCKEKKKTLRALGLSEIVCPADRVTILPHELAGRDFCRFFFAKAMLHTAYDKGSADSQWHSRATRYAMCRVLLGGQCRVAELSTASIFRAFSMSRYLPAIFSPGAAAQCLSLAAEVLGATRGAENLNGLRVLDPCSGWGSRFFGFWVSPRFSTYAGIDPNIRLQLPYKKMSAWLSAHMTHLRPNGDMPTFSFLRARAEDASWITALFPRNGRTKYFDVVFTSPPYYDTEIYAAEDPEQSCNRYPSYDLWRDGFLGPMLHNSTSCLKDDGVVCLNVKNCKSCPRLVQDTAEIMADLGFGFHSCTLLFLAKRPRRLPASGAASPFTPPYEPVLFFTRRLLKEE